MREINSIFLLRARLLVLVCLCLVCVHVCSFVRCVYLSLCVCLCAIVHSPQSQIHSIQHPGWRRATPNRSTIFFSYSREVSTSLDNFPALLSNVQIFRPILSYTAYALSILDTPTTPCLRIGNSLHKHAKDRRSCALLCSTRSCAHIVKVLYSVHGAVRASKTRKIYLRDHRTS